MEIKLDSISEFSRVIVTHDNKEWFGKYYKTVNLERVLFYYEAMILSLDMSLEEIDPFLLHCFRDLPDHVVGWHLKLEMIKFIKGIVNSNVPIEIKIETAFSYLEQISGDTL